MQYVVLLIVVYYLGNYSRDYPFLSALNKHCQVQSKYFDFIKFTCLSLPLSPSSSSGRNQRERHTTQDILDIEEGKMEKYRDHNTRMFTLSGEIEEGKENRDTVVQLHLKQATRTQHFLGRQTNSTH